MTGTVGTVSGIEGCVVGRVAVGGGGGTRHEVGARGHKTRRGAIEGRAIAVGGRRGVGGRESR